MLYEFILDKNNHVIKIRDENKVEHELENPIKKEIAVTRLVFILKNNKILSFRKGGSGASNGTANVNTGNSGIDSGLGDVINYVPLSQPNAYYRASKLESDSWKWVVQFYPDGHAGVVTNFFKITNTADSKIGITNFVWSPAETKTLYVVGKTYTAPNVREEKKFSAGARIRVKNDAGILKLIDVYIKYEKYLDIKLEDLTFSRLKGSTSLYRNKKEFVHIDHIFKKQPITDEIVFQSLKNNYKAA